MGGWGKVHGYVGGWACMCSCAAVSMYVCISQVLITFAEFQPFSFSVCPRNFFILFYFIFFYV